MRAAVLTRYREPLEFRDNLPMPVAGPADVVIRVEACGICRSDWHLWQEDWTWIGISVPLPRVQGHEFGGVVEEVGSEVRILKRGDRVTVPFHIACGHCDYCHTGRSNICYALGFFGFHHDGGFGEYAALPNADVNAVRLPEKVDAVSAAALGCRFMTAYHGIVDQANVRPGEWVTVFGAGGVGLASVQIAKALGGRVIAVSRDAAKLAQAREEGALHIVTAGERAVEQIKDLTGGGADVSVDAFGGSATLLPGVMSLRKGGRHVQLGLTGKDDSGAVSLPIDAIVAQELKLFGSVGCPTTSYPGMLSMIAAGQLNPSRLVSERVDASQVTRVFNEMTEFKTLGFHVITSWKGTH
jgi:D-arabinose 1-dehydrogenase-like Zn-dependent alcohol dehydrogenase